MRLVVTATAARQIREAFAWWVENRSAAPDLLRSELRRAYELITQPGSGPLTDNVEIPGVRRVLLRRTRYHLGGLRHLDVHGADEIVIGYAFFPEFWGRGFATEIARNCVAIARDRLGPESVVSDALPTNAASRRVMVKAGLVYERDVTLDGIPLVLYRSPPLSSWALDEVYELEPNP